MKRRGPEYLQTPVNNALTKLMSDIIYARWAGIENVYQGGKPDVTLRKFKNFLNRMGWSDMNEQNLIDVENTSFEDGIINSRVRKLSELDKEEYYDVQIVNVCKDSASEEEKFKTINSVYAACSCPAHKRQIIPSVNLPSDKHVFMALNDAVVKRGAYDLEVFGYPESVVQAEKDLMKRMKRKGIRKEERWSNRELNKTFSYYGNKIVEPLTTFIERMSEL